MSNLLVGSPVGLWRECLWVLSGKVNREAFSTWFKSTRGLELDEGHLLVGTPNQFAADWLKEHYLEQIAEAFKEVGWDNLKVEFKVCEELCCSENQMEILFPLASEDRTKAEGRISCPFLNPNYTFASFVVGESNRFAQAVAQAVAEAPGSTRYNPLYIYGGTGLGKTHLVQALGNQAFQDNPALKVVYATSERFTSDFISGLSGSNMSEFKLRYRQADLLMVDDIQFLSGKESTQVQFFHTFNELHLAGKQIVLTSDRPPKEIKGLEERLLSRFQWGLVTDIQPPDLETRIAILNKKAMAEGVNLPPLVSEYIAQHFTANVRLLEGALIRLLAYASVSGGTLDPTLAQKVLGDSAVNGHREIKLDDLIREVASAFGTPPLELVSKRKTQEVAWARQVGMYLARDLTSSSLKVIGAAFGGRDHSTVIYACGVVEKVLISDLSLKKKLDQIINRLHSA